MASRGAFSTYGQQPQIDDARVMFVKGFFQETLRPFLEATAIRNRLVVNVDLSPPCSFSARSTSNFCPALSSSSTISTQWAKSSRLLSTTTGRSVATEMLSAGFHIASKQRSRSGLSLGTHHAILQLQTRYLLRFRATLRPDIRDALDGITGLFAITFFFLPDSCSTTEPRVL